MSLQLRTTQTQRLEPGGADSGGRRLFIDNLRWITIVLVVSMHAADTYSPLGSWYYVDRRPISLPTYVFFAAWQMFLQSFFMGVLFFIAGFFVPHSFDRKGPGQFVRDRLVRLGLPVLLYMLVIGPITEYYAAHSWNSTLPTSFAHEWIKHIRNGKVLQESGPLWFCVALLIFSFIYVALRALIKGNQINPANYKCPGTMTLVWFGLLMAFATFVVRLARPSSVLNLPVADFAQYVLLFSAGTLAARRQWLAGLRLSTGTRWIVAALFVGLPLWFTLLFTGGFFRGNESAFSGGFHWQSAGFAIWESLTCVAMSYGLLAVLWAKFNGQGRTARFMSANAFSVYVFHPPILIFAARMIHGLAWPSVLMFLMLTLIAVVGSFALSAALFRRIPLLKRIL
jgi:fucose 4-O-acetylase-like acetyltransferase